MATGKPIRQLCGCLLLRGARRFTFSLFSTFLIPLSFLRSRYGPFHRLVQAVFFLGFWVRQIRDGVIDHG